MNGLLAGLNTFILSQSGGNEGLGFAIPSNTVKEVYLQLRALAQTQADGKMGKLRHVY
jgi:S1-C subfamily serine protease